MCSLSHCGLMTSTVDTCKGANFRVNCFKLLLQSSKYNLPTPTLLCDQHLQCTSSTKYQRGFIVYTEPEEQKRARVSWVFIFVSPLHASRRLGWSETEKKLTAPNEASLHHQLLHLNIRVSSCCDTTEHKFTRAKGKRGE